ncbi:MAG: LAGLIDADG family homing endonuclease [Candidatus Hodarchaeota archaeon]
MSEKNKRAWTEEEINFLLNNTNLKDIEFTKKLNRSIHSIRGKRRQYYRKYNSTVRCSIDMNFFKAWTDEMVYVLGFIYADGCVQIINSAYELKIKIKDRKLLEKINNLMKSNYPIRSQRSSTGFIYSLSITRKKIVEDLLRLGLTANKSLTMQFPEIPPTYLFHFIRGYFDGDGNTGISKNYLIIEFTSGSKDFLQKLKEILDKLNISCSFRESIRKYTSYSLRILADSRKIFYQLLYENATIFLERKYNIMKYYFENIHNKWKLMNCIDCGIELQKNNNNHKRCSKCQSIVNKESYMRYYYKNQDKKRAYKKQRYHQKKRQ